MSLLWLDMLPPPAWRLGNVLLRSLHDQYMILWSSIITSFCIMMMTNNNNVSDYSFQVHISSLPLPDARRVLLAIWYIPLQFCCCDIVVLQIESQLRVIYPLFWFQNAISFAITIFIYRGITWTIQQEFLCSRLKRTLMWIDQQLVLLFICSPSAMIMN